MTGPLIAVIFDRDSHGKANEISIHLASCPTMGQLRDLDAIEIAEAPSLSALDRHVSKALIGHADVSADLGGWGYHVCLSSDPALRPADETACDNCFVQSDGSNENGVCPCSIREPRGGCRCVESPAAWYGPGEVRRELLAEEM